MCVKPIGTIATPKLQHQKTLHQINSWQFEWCNVLHRVISNRFPPICFDVCNVFCPQWYTKREREGEGERERERERERRQREQRQREGCLGRGHKHLWTASEGEMRLRMQPAWGTPCWCGCGCSGWEREPGRNPWSLKPALLNGRFGPAEARRRIFLNFFRKSSL